MKRNFLLIPQIIVLLLLHIYVSGQTTTTTVIYPDKDTYINKNTLNTLAAEAANTGDHNYFKAEKAEESNGSWTTYRSLMQFDLSSIPTNATIISAELYLKGASHQFYNESYLYKNTMSWGEETATWQNNAGNYTTEGGIYLSPSTSPQEDYNIDISGFVQDWVSGEPNYGFMMKLANEDMNNPRSMYFRSSDWTTTSERPKLTIVYDANPTGSMLYNPIDLGVLPTNTTTTQSINNCTANNYGDNFGEISSALNQPSDDIFYQFTQSTDSYIYLNTCGSSLENIRLYLLDETGNVLKANNTGGKTCPNDQYNYSIFQQVTPGIYYVVVEGLGTSCGNIDLEISDPPAIAINPSNTTVCSGGSASYSISTSSPVDSYQWELSSDGGSTWTPFGPNKESVTIDQVNRSMNGFAIRCKTVWHNVEFASDAAMLYVTPYANLQTNIEPNRTGESSLIINPVKDAWISNIASSPESKTMNYGADPGLYAYCTATSSPTFRRSFIEIDFAQLPKNAEIVSCILTLKGIEHHLGTTGTKDNTMYVSPVTGPWEEMEITWENQPDINSNASYSVLVQGTPNPGTNNYQDNVEIDITNIAKEWHTEALPNYGLLMRLNNEDWPKSAYFGSSDHPNSAYRPTVKIIYTVPTTVYCSDGQVSIQATGASSYSWEPAPGISCTGCPNQSLPSVPYKQEFIFSGTSNGCTTNHTFQLERCDPYYGVVNKELNTDSYLANNGCLYFKFTEDYNIENNTSLNYGIYDDLNQRVADGTLPAITVRKGANYCSVNLNGKVPPGRYVLKVTNSKGDVFNLLFESN